MDMSQLVITFYKRHSNIETEVLISEKKGTLVKRYVNNIHECIFVPIIFVKVHFKKKTRC